MFYLLLVRNKFIGRPHNNASASYAVAAVVVAAAATAAAASWQFIQWETG